MNFNRKIKLAIFDIFKLKIINYPFALFCSVLRAINIPSINHIFARLPLNKRIKAVTPDKNSFYMISDGSDGIANEIYWFGLDSYEIETISIFWKLLGITGTFFDVGANTGIYSLIAASKGREKTVHAFEPVDRAYIWLAENRVINGFENMFPNKIALSNFDGEISFNVQVHSPRIPLGSSIRNDMGGELDTELIVVPTMKLDTYVKLHNVDSIDLMKIDTEGTEDKVFEGADYVLDSFRPVMICEVLSNLIEDKLQSILTAKNYRFYKITANGPESKDLIKGDPVKLSNYLFIPAEKTEFVLSTLCEAGNKH